MNAHKKVKVECLAWKEAWDLFLANVGEEAMNSHPEIPTLAEIIAKKCHGLPLGLITIGRAMAASMKTLEEWKHARTVLSKSASDFPGMEDEVLPLLKFSYDSLDGDIVKLCFLYCSLYHEDCSIDKHELIEKWIGEGFLDECDNLDEARNMGHHLIGKLKVACLLEDGDSPVIRVKMHDIIRELALWIASEYGEGKDKFYVRANIGLTDAQILEKWKDATRISLMKNELQALIETPTCRNLITLMLQGNHKLSMISNSVFQFMPLLRVLDLSNATMKELPIGIGELFELQYLNLSNTKIVALPGELVCLVKLKHLDLSGTSNLETIPYKVIAGLERLQVLNLYASNYKYWKVMGSDYDESRVDLTELEGLNKQNDLGITISNVLTLNRFSGSQMFAKCARYLQIKECNSLTCFQLSSTFGNMERLQTLDIGDCSTLEELIIDAEVGSTNWLLSGLEILYLWKLYKLQTILVPHECLQNLRVVNIYECHKLKNIT